MAGEEVADGGPGPDGLGPALLPRAAGQVGERGGLHGLRDREVADLRVARVADLALRVHRARDGPLHVGLPAADPDVAHQDVPEVDRGFPADCERVGPARLEGADPSGPLAVLIRDRLGRLVGHADGDFLPGLGPSPDGDRDLALEDHMVSEHLRDAEARLGGEGEEQQREEDSHRGPV